jgi:hypothetical protein
MSRCSVSATLRPVNELAYCHTASAPIAIGDLQITPIEGKPGWFDVGGTIESSNQIDSLKRARNELLALPHTLTFVSGTAYTIDIGEVRQLDGAMSRIQIGHRTDAFLSLDCALGPTEVQAWKNLQELLVRTGDQDSVRLIVSDLRLAAESQDKFALIHMYRALDTINAAVSGDTGKPDWKNLRQKLGVSKPLLESVKRWRSEPQYRIAHSNDGNADSLSELSGEDIRVAFRNTAEIVRAFLEYLDEQSANA